MVAYACYAAAELGKAVGLDAAGGRRKSDGRAGHLCFGPYITLGPGRYTAGFYIQRDPDDDEGEIELDVCTERGRRVIAGRTLPVSRLFASVDGLVPLDFSLDAVERDCELRLKVPARAQIEVSRAVVFRRDVAARRAR